MSDVRIARLSTAAAGFEAELARLRHWSDDTDRAVEDAVTMILANVRERGDAALLEYTARFDKLTARSVAELEIGAGALKQAFDTLPAAQRDALQAAAARVRHYHEHQMRASCQSWQVRDGDGSLLGQKVTPIDRVGIYVPGGKAAYPSSVLMNAIPAQVAGVGEIVMVVPTPNGERNPLVLAAAHLAGAHRVFAIGGAQAIGALAYGTATIPRVDKITGPGNAYVASAKRRVFGQVGIDMIAGPSEILVLADGTVEPDWVALDLFSQAEHDELAQGILLSPDAAYLDAVQAAIDRLLPSLPRHAVIRASLEARGALVLTRSMAEACELSNRIAPEHLEICAREPQRWEPLLKHAGAIFLGGFTSESLGDYCAGRAGAGPGRGRARARRGAASACARGAGAPGRTRGSAAHGLSPAHRHRCQCRCLDPARRCAGAAGLGGIGRQVAGAGFGAAGRHAARHLRRRHAGGPAAAVGHAARSRRAGRSALRLAHPG
jgi:histidinol dehydrogenase